MATSRRFRAVGGGAGGAAGDRSAAPGARRDGDGAVRTQRGRGRRDARAACGRVRRAQWQAGAALFGQPVDRQRLGDMAAPLAVNDQPGKWTVRVRDVMSGQRVEAAVEAQ